MASHIKRGESILIPFRAGQSISDSQLKPRMYKTMQAFEKSFPGHHLGAEGVELVEYAEVVRCKACEYGCEDHEDAYLCNNGFNGLIGFTRGDDFCSYGERRADNG